MKSTVGVRELKNRLTRYLRLVQQGKEIVVTDRGTPVAMLCPFRKRRSKASVEAHVSDLAARGLLIPGSGVRLRPAADLPEAELSSAILADRDERR